MPEFLVRAHSAPVRARAFIDAVGSGAHVEYLAQIVVNTLFVSRGHRAGDVLTLVLEQSDDFSRAVSIRGDSLGNIGGMTEAAVIGVIADALDAGQSLGKEEVTIDDRGIVVRAISFERLLKEKLAAGQVLLLDKKGSDVRDSQLDPDACVVLTDHVPLPKNLRKSVLRQGAIPVSLGPVMLHASQCIVLVQNEYDRRAARLYSGR